MSQTKRLAGSISTYVNLKTSCVQRLNFRNKNICIFIDSFNEGGGENIILRIYNVVIELFNTEYNTNNYSESLFMS